MIRKNAYLQLTMIFLILLSLLLLVNHQINPNIDLRLALFSTVVFYFYTAWSFFKTKKIQNTNPEVGFFKNLYANLFYKMFLIVGMPLGFYILLKPNSSSFVIPYILVYLIFLIFETSTLYRLSGRLK
jgi:hypothetical protein